jgi:hypothetical protein
MRLAFPAPHIRFTGTRFKSFVPLGLRSSGVMSAQAFEYFPRGHVRPRIGESLVHLPPQRIIEPG